jgi:hypothetical protein
MFHSTLLFSAAEFLSGCLTGCRQNRARQAGLPHLPAFGAWCKKLGHNI